MTKETQQLNNATNNAINETAKAAALLAIESFDVEPTSLIQYRSAGRVAVIGGPEAQEFASRLTGNLNALVLLTGGAVEPGVTAIPVGNRRLQIEGYLGNFSIFLGDEGQANYETVKVDLILDLSEQSCLTMPLKPPGYLTAIAEEPYLTVVEEELKTLTGTFEKPKYFDYDAAICVHGRSGIDGCSRCIDACPAEAISSLLESVKVNANLCQGGGICASVCPTGAIRYVYPKATDTLRTVRTLLKTYNQAQGTRPIIAFIAETELAVLENEAANLLVVVVEELASVGMEVWLSAMAYGANQVLLINAAAMPAMVSEFLQQEIKTAEVILSGLAYNSPDESQKSIRLVTPDSLSQFCDAENNFALRKVASYVGSPEKRRTTLLAIDHLYQQNDSAPQIISLPEHASFGRIMVDGNACTLCMSCTSVCPAKAIDAGNDFPRLEFHELNCVQCGICAAACPEHAITLEPRLITDIEQRRRVVTLHEEVPFCCITCGKAFATKSLIDNMAKKLEGHYMFNSQRAKQRLMMCEDCRVIDVVQDEAAMHVI